MKLELDFDNNHRSPDPELIPRGSTVSARRFFSLLTTGSEGEAEEILDMLEERDVLIDLELLPAYAGSGSLGERLALEHRLAREENGLSRLEKSDPLAMYLRELDRLPCLTEEQATALGEAGGHGLTEGLMYLVRREAVAMTGRGVLLADLIQEGSLGLMRALEQPEAGLFARIRRCVRQAMARPILLQYLAGGDARRLLEDLHAYNEADRRLLNTLGRNPSLEELAEAMSKTPEQTELLSRMVKDAAKAPAAQKAPEEEEEPESVEDSAYFQLRTTVEELLGLLEETDRRLLSLRFGLEGKAPLSVPEAANALGLTPEEAERREAEAIALLRLQG